jgi:dipeptidyl aminopeptidase/acylaminoacyl peptidase
MSLLRRRLVVLSLLLCAASAITVAQSAFPTNEDLRHFRSVNDPRLSPDGKQVLYRVTDSTADGGRSHLWLTDIGQNAPRQLTFSPTTDKRGERAGEWTASGDGILFLAKRGEHTQLFLLPMKNGGEAQAFDLKVLPTVDVTKLPGYIDTGAAAKSDETKATETKTAESKPVPIDVNSFAVAPAGKWIAIIAKDPESAAEKKQRDDKADANWVDHDVHGSRLYLLDPETSKLTTVDVPPDVDRVSWSADGGKLLVITEGPNNASDLGFASKSYLVELANPIRVSELDKLPAAISTGAWSPDARVIYFGSQAAKDTPPNIDDLYEYDVATKSIRNLTDGFPGTMSHESPISLLAGGVLKGVAVGVNTSAIRIKAGQSPERLQFPTALAGSFHSNARQTGWVYLGTSSTQPVALYYTANLTQTPQTIAIPKLTPDNLKPVASKLVRYPSEKFTIEGLLYLPPEAATRKVPLIMDIHGGPAGAWQDGYDAFAQYLVGQGWAVFRPNIRGSSNYGAEFVAANKNDLGGGDYRDVMNGVDYVLKNFPLDENHMALIGYSYGGEMAGFVVGKTNRFKAIVCGAPVINQFSEYGTEDGSWYDRWYYGKPWEHFEDAWRQSPLSGAAKASTPFLLLQGETDKTDPLGESQQMYRALRQMNVPVELVTYPREDHGGLARGMFGAPSLEPWHGFDGRRRTVEFIKKYFDAAK